RWRHSSCVWFQMLGVEAHSFLPDDQGNGCHPARQRQPRHFRPDSLSHQRIVKLLERARLRSGHGGSTLEKILQFVIVIAIQPTNRGRLLGVQLSLHERDAKSKNYEILCKNGATDLIVIICGATCCKQER
ncbi:MAG: hypothetical protein WA641_09565, partial [Candidatus Acidiferrales bacterium]